ncbi:GerAB/ArcD/ProY family transporter [Pseudalkalibacillus hwajinpoensis]|uniref:GerAB/ArcD/ProY family transporter n=1 Tax=Guptibacillus hwajinpoensis TaxID=208199 RepID=UPI00325BE96D
MEKIGGEITQQQLFFLIIQTQIGIGVLSLAFNVFTAAKQDAWIAMLIAGLMVQFSIMIIWLLCQRFPSSMLYSMVPQISGKWIGNLLNCGYLVYFTMTAALVLTLHSQIISNWVLPETPSWIISLLMTGTGIYICMGNLKVLGRFFSFVSLFLVVLFLLMTYGLKDANFLYLLPVGEAGMVDLLKGAKEAVISQLGFEMLLVVFPFVIGKSSKTLKTASWANLVVVLFYTYTIFVTLSYFSPEELKFVPQPVIYMLKAFEFSVLSRVDLVFLSIWVVSVTTSFMIYLYMASKGIAYFFKSSSHWKYVPWIGGLAFSITLFLNGDEQLVSRFSTYVSQLGILFVLIIPILLLLSSYLFHKKEAMGGMSK